jgi:hypothetical protein
MATRAGSMQSGAALSMIQRVAAADDVIDHFGLQAAERRVAEDAAQHVQGCAVCRVGGPLPVCVRGDRRRGIARGGTSRFLSRQGDLHHGRRW